MSVTILEALRNAQINLVDNHNLQLAVHIGKVQLNNAIVLLDKGYSPNDDFDEVMGDYENVNDVPQKELNANAIH